MAENKQGKVNFNNYNTVGFNSNTKKFNTNVNTPKNFPAYSNISKNTMTNESKSGSGGGIRLDFSLESYKKSGTVNKTSMTQAKINGRGNSFNFSTNSLTEKNEKINYSKLKNGEKALKVEPRLLSTGMNRESRDNSVNYSMFTTISRGNDRVLNNANSRLRKEIETFSKSLQESKISNISHVNRPQIDLNKPELELNPQKFLDFSPTMNKRNLMVTSNVARNFQGDNSSLKTISSYNHKPRENNYQFGLNFLKNNQKERERERDSNIFSPGDTASSGFRLSFINSGVNNPQNEKKFAIARDSNAHYSGYVESVEDFEKDFSNSNATRKVSYIEKYSPKKKNKDA